MTYSVFGIETETGVQVVVSQSARRQGLYIIGATGTGKTGLIENLIIQDIKQGLGVGLLDPHGDLTNAVLSRLPDTRVVDGVKRITEEDVILLDIKNTQYPFGLNLFSCPDPSDLVALTIASAHVMHIFRKLWGKGGILVEDAWGVLLEKILENATLTLLENPGYTMAEIPLLLDVENPNFRKKLIQNLMSDAVRDFWEHDFATLPSKDQRQEIQSTLNRVNSFLRQQLVRNIIGQSRTTIDFRSIMDERKILLVRLNVRLGEGITTLLGTMILAGILDAAYSRADLPVNKRKQFNLYADEFQRFASEDFATLLTEARKYGIATTIAHQMRNQLDTQNRGATLNVANLVVFKISGADATELAVEFDITPQEAWEEEIEEEWLEVLQEEWTEKVEDEVIDGEEPVQVYKREVVDHLLKQGHEDERVMQFVKTYLRPLSLATKKDISYWFASGQRFTVQQAYVDFNIWLYEGMADPINLFQPLPESFLWLIQLLTSYKINTINDPFYEFLYSFRVVDRFEDGKKIEIVRPATEKMLEEYTRLTKQLREAVLTLLPQQPEDFHDLRRSLFSQPQFTRMYRDAVEKRSLYEAKRAISKEADEREKKSGSGWRKTGRIIDGATEVEPNLTPSEYAQALATYQQRSKEAIEKGYSLFEQFSQAAQLCQYALWQHPLMTTDSGLYQPRKRTQVHYCK